MAGTATITKSVVIDGHGGTMSRTGTSFDVAERIAGSGVNVPIAYAGTLTGRTDNDTGIVTTTNAPAIVTSDKVDVYWSGGQRRNMTATVSGNAVTVDLGGGTNLPVLTTACVVVKATVVTFATITMANVKALVAKITGTSAVCQVSIGVTSGSYTEGDSMILNNPATTGHVYGDTYCWDDLFSEANELAGAATFNTLYVSHADTVNSATFSLDIGT